MNKVSIVIPSRDEKYLSATVNDVLHKAKGDIEIIVILDGAKDNPPLLENDTNYPVHIIYKEKPEGMRAAINSAAKIATGECLLKCDAHCMFMEGFDEILKQDCEENWVVIPRRLRLDAENWKLKPITDSEPPIDYEYFIYPRKFTPNELHGFKWNERTKERKDILIDDTLSFQGSCWFMHKTHFEKCKFMQIEGYNGLPQQEAEEIGLTTWLSGGKVKVNKNVWYAHWFKGKNRGYYIGRTEGNECYAYSYNHWVIEHKEEFTKLIEKFMPLPGWPPDWKGRIFK
jgi:glycosyltransferase involved in cell wall biosynthesis